MSPIKKPCPVPDIDSIVIAKVIWQLSYIITVFEYNVLSLVILCRFPVLHDVLPVAT